jgi:hypothetical protein
MLDEISEELRVGIMLEEGVFDATELDAAELDATELDATEATAHALSYHNAPPLLAAIVEVKTKFIV